MTVINAKVKFEPDESSLDELEDQLDERTNSQTEVSGNVEEGDSPTTPQVDGDEGGLERPGGSRRGGGGGGAAAGVAGGAATRGGTGGILKSILNVLNSALKWLAIIGLVALVVGGIIEVFEPILDILSVALQVVLIPFMRVVLNTFLPFAIAALEMALAFVDLVESEGLAVALSTVVIGALFAIKRAIFNMTQALLKAIIDSLIGALAAIKAALLKLPRAILDVLIADISWFANLPGVLASLIKGAIPGVGDIPGSGIVGGVAGAAGIELAEGGIATSTTQATVGEAGPEAIIPLDQIEDLVSVNVQPDIDMTPVVSQLSDIESVLRDIRSNTGSGSTDTRSEASLQ